MQYYNDLIDELERNEIGAMATLYHWDLPQPLQDVGGWLNDTVIGHFRDYADVCFKELGDKVRYHSTPTANAVMLIPYMLVLFMYRR